MRLMEGRYQEAVGVWEEADGLIIVKELTRQTTGFPRPERPLGVNAAEARCRR
jgi:hypothetical protein